MTRPSRPTSKRRSTDASFRSTIRPRTPRQRRTDTLSLQTGQKKPRISRIGANRCRHSFRQRCRVNVQAMPLDFTNGDGAPVPMTCCKRVEELSHIDMDRSSRWATDRHARRATHGLQASLTPLRFEGGADGRRGPAVGDIVCPRVFDRHGVGRCLYVLNVLPAAVLRSPVRGTTDDGCARVVAHLAQQMDGDLRRHEGRCYAHGRVPRRGSMSTRRASAAPVARVPTHRTIMFLLLESSFARTRRGTRRALSAPATETPNLAPLPTAGVLGEPIVAADLLAFKLRSSPRRSQ